MSAYVETQSDRTNLTLVRFSPTHAPHIAGWVATDQELHWLAPGTPPPLTAEKVIAWKRPNGTALVAVERVGTAPIGYAELNPMKGDANRQAGLHEHLWIGHVVVAPQLRGGGIGQAFVHSLLAYAFGTLAADRITLVVFPENRSAIQCYQSVGFSIVQEERHRFGKSSTRHKLLRLSLDASGYTARIHE